MKFAEHNIMIDIETLGTLPGSAIVSIGAVRFDIPEKGTPQVQWLLEDVFYREISQKSNFEAGLTSDPATVKWWSQQSVEARSVLHSMKAVPLKTALEDLLTWKGKTGAELWANGANFDFPLLHTAAHKVGLRLPWAFWKEKCFRTLKGLFPEVEYEKPKKAHMAHEDAIAQAEHVCKIVDFIREKGL